MPVFRIGETELTYSLRRSETAMKASITVTPAMIDVTVPMAATDAQIEAVLHRHRAWLLGQSQAMKEKQAAAHRVYSFVTGAKIPFRGRMMKLRLEQHEGALVEVTYRNGFHIKVPASVDSLSADALIESALRLWLRKKMREDAQAFIARHGAANGLKPRGLDIKDQKHMWGSCGADRIINLNWHLIFAPKPVLEYAVVHEMCHLKHRNHEPEFWNLLGSILPDWESRKAWLDENEHLLKFDRVDRLCQ
jgi:predicted metal-dependent hydrolase